MAFDFKKEYKEFYLPKNKPEIIEIPKMNYIAVRGKGNPNEKNGEYHKAIEILYGVAFTIKMSPKAGHLIDGFFEYVVPPLEGFWWQEKNGEIVAGFDYSSKETFNWISVIRLPEFVSKSDFDWAVGAVTKKNFKKNAKLPDEEKLDYSKAEFLTIDEGSCVQIMHIGAFDDEPATVAIMDEFLASNGYVNDFSDTRLHHEIYLSDARKVPVEKWRTVIRHPVKGM